MSKLYTLPSNECPLARRILTRLLRNNSGRRYDENYCRIVTSNGILDINLLLGSRDVGYAALISINSRNGEKNVRRVRNALRRGGVNLGGLVTE